MWFQLYSWGINFINHILSIPTWYHFIDIHVHVIEGAPSQEFLEQPITASDHPFLRANVTSIKAHKMQQRALKGKSV